MSECTACGVGCPPGAADACVARTCRCGDGPACGGATPFCVGGGCAACRDDGDCAGGRCRAGRCERCDPRTHEGCGGATPVCASDGSRCEACTEDEQCRQAGAGAVCVDGRCAECHPSGRGCLLGVCDPSALTCVECTPLLDTCGVIDDGFACRDNRCVCVDDDECRCGRGRHAPECREGQRCELASRTCF
jgi:hypothetical protein